MKYEIQLAIHSEPVWVNKHCIYENGKLGPEFFDTEAEAQAALQALFKKIDDGIIEETPRADFRIRPLTVRKGGAR